MTITWAPPLLPGGVIISYQLYVNYFNGSTEMRKLGITTYYVLNDLMPNQWIGIDISASTKVGEGPRSLMVRGRTGMFEIDMPLQYMWIYSCMLFSLGDFKSEGVPTCHHRALVYFS